MRSSCMAVGVEQVFEGKLVPGFAEPTLVTVIQTDEPALRDIEAALAENEAGLIVEAATSIELEAHDAHVYVLHGLSGVTPCREVEELVEQVPSPLVLVVPSSATVKEMRATLRAGVAGLVRECDICISLAATVRAVRGGQLVVPFELGRQIAKPVLSRRQKQVLGLVVLGLSNGEIAAKLHLSEHTVKCHLYSGFRKLGVSSRDEAVATILDPEGGLGTGILAISEAESEVATHGHR
jgi:DNA-binding NarL/FixJ family response regulator